MLPSTVNIKAIFFLVIHQAVLPSSCAQDTGPHSGHCFNMHSPFVLTFQISPLDLVSNHQCFSTKSQIIHTHYLQTTNTKRTLAAYINRR